MSVKNLLSVSVPCIDRKSRQRFSRDFWLDLSTLSEEDRLVLDAATTNPVSPAAFVSIRHYFHIGSMPNVSFEEDLDLQSSRMFGVFGYYEDEEGNPLDEIDFITIATGKEHPIIAHNVESVLRLGPTGIVRKDSWSVETANAIAHFLQLVDVIGISGWLKSELSISYEGMSTTPKDVKEFRCPNLGQVYSVLLPIRQLYASDHVFNRAIKGYLRHASDERKRWWIEGTKRKFNALLGSIPQPATIENHTVQKLLDIVIYGAGLVHFHETDLETKGNFNAAVTKYPREWLTFVFLSCCYQLYHCANAAYHVIRQDFDHWITNEGCAPPDLVFMRALFSSRPEEPSVPIDDAPVNPLSVPPRTTARWSN